MQMLQQKKRKERKGEKEKSVASLAKHLISFLLSSIFNK